MSVDVPVRSRRRAPRPSRWPAVLLVGALTFAPGCASLTGLVTGAFTGAIDAPAQVYRYNRDTFEDHPEYWIWNLLVFVPVGLVVGPLAGLSKGVGLDVEWMLNEIGYGPVFGSYDRPSIWRPYTIHW